jgi:lipopolysaccharide export system protein LptA
VNKWRALATLSIAGLVGTLTAQTPANKPLTEQDFLKKMDSIGTPAKKVQLGLEGTGLDEKKKAPPPKKSKGETVITSTEETTFDQKTHEAVFIGKVVVKDPEFNVECDRLDAFLKKDTEKTAKANPPPVADPPPTANGAEPDKNKPKTDSGGLDHAIADANPGNVVVITQDKVEADGSISKNIGKAHRATYNARTGDVVLTGNPSVLQGINLCVALDESTVMTLNRDGRMKVDGPSKIVIKDSSTIDGK